MTAQTLEQAFGAHRKVIEYEPSPTLWEFHASNAFFRAVMGPFGSGKSSAMVMEIRQRAEEARRVQLGNGREGPRKSRWAVIRGTYPKLKTTTIETFSHWLPPENFGPITFGSPITYKLKWNAPDGVAVELEIWFMSMDRPKDRDKLRSLDITGAWINECSEIDEGAVNFLIDRVGRYPAASEGGPSWYGIIADTNPVDELHWYYNWAEKKKPSGELDGYEFYRQPGGLLEIEDGVYVPNPDAENVQYLPGGYDYYLRGLGSKTKQEINTNVLGRYGTTGDGKAVYGNYFNERMHIAKYDLLPIKGLPILLGWDYGLSPAVAIAQITPQGRLHILQEIIGDNIGVRDFALEFVRPTLRTVYKGYSLISVGDPAGKEMEADGRSVFDHLKEVGIPTTPSIDSSNRPKTRINAVRSFLKRNVAGLGAILIDPRCLVLKSGMNGSYKYRRINSYTNSEIYSDEPVKDSYSHVQDALGYLCLDLTGDIKDAKDQQRQNEYPKTQRHVVSRRAGY